MPLQLATVLRQTGRVLCGSGRSRRGWEAGDGETEQTAGGDMAGEGETAAVSENQSGAKQRCDNKTVIGSW